MSTDIAATEAPPTPTRTPRVLAVLVVSNGAEWALGALRTLRAQRYPALDVIAVDNASTDGSGELLRSRLPADRVISSETNVGFGRAVGAAVRHAGSDDADYVLLVHDDMALMPDAVQWLVDAMEKDPSLAIVGPKLREWTEEPLLQQVGMATDPFGRAAPGFDLGELDQGQHDHRGDVLYVSTAGMLLRRDVFSSIGGFDARFDAFRDDLDLCWRAWIAGRRVAVVTEAVGYHIAAASNVSRSGAFETVADARYRIERHTLASILKNYSLRRLLWVLPTLSVLMLIRVLGLLLSRRFAEAWAVVRAGLWNLGQLPQTLRRRRRVQGGRRQSDRALRALFAPPTAGLRNQVDALLGGVSGGSTRALFDDDVAAVDPLAEQPILRALRDRAVLLVGLPLLGALLLSIAGFYGSGPVIGGEIGAWPEAAGEFFSSYLSPWTGEPLASASFPSPVQAILGFASSLAFGSAWLAQRLLTFGLLAVAWFVALRAGRVVTSRAWPRVAGASVYALSPAVLGTLAEGRWSVLVVATFLPGVVALTIRTADPSTTGGAAWRSTALLSLSIVIVLGAAPVEGLLAPAVVLVGALVALVRRWALPLGRLVIAGASGLAILSPWLFDVLRDGGPAGDTLSTAGGPPAIIDLPLWRALLGVPQTVDGLDGALGIVVVAVPVAILFGAIFVGMRARPLVTAGLVLGFVAFGSLAWAAAAFRAPLVWAPALLLPAALCMSMLAVIVIRWSLEILTGQDFGVAQVGTVLAGMGMTVGLLGAAGLLAGGPWTELRQDPQLLPEFIAAEAEQVGSYRVLLLDRRPDGQITWEVVGPDGPQMTAYAALRSDLLTSEIDQAVVSMVAGVDGAPGATLGLLNVRYVVLLAPDAALQTALARQSDLLPLPTDAAVTYRVGTWLPRASVIPEGRIAALLGTRDPGTADAMAVAALSRTGPTEFRGVGTARGGLLVLSEATSGLWRAGDGSQQLDSVELPPINAFRVSDVDAPRLVVVASGGLRRRLVVAGQLLLALIVISLAIRPPGARRETAAAPRALPAALGGIADVTESIPRISADRPPGGDGSPDGAP